MIIHSRRLAIVFLIILILTLILHLIYVFPKVARARRSAHTFSRMVLAVGAASAVPYLVAGTMIYLFMFTGVASTVQYNAGSVSAMNRWSDWVELCPLFLILSAVNGIVNLITAVTCLVETRLRPWAVPALFTTLLSGLAFCAVIEFAPTA